MKIEIEIDENYIAELVSQDIARRVVAERGYEVVEKAIKLYIYSKKDEVIDRVIERASVEIVKRVCPSC